MAKIKDEFRDYVISRCQNTLSPLNVTQISRDFKIESISEESVDYLRKTASKIGLGIHESSDLGKKSKIRVLFALKAPVNAEFLKEIRKDAKVVVDARRRLTMYRSNDKSLILKEGHDTEQPIVMDDDSDDEMRRSGRISRKRHLEDEYLYFERRRSRSSASRRTPLTTPSKLKRHRSSALPEVKLEPFEERKQDSLNEKASPSQLIQVEVEKEPPIQNPVTVKPEIISPPRILQIIPANDHIKLLESLQTVLSVLENPLFKELETRIQRKIEKFKIKGNLEEKVTFAQIQGVISTAILIIWKASLMNNSEGSESMSLKEFFLILRTSMMSLKIPRIEICQRKIKERISMLSTGDRKFSIPKIKSFIRPILDVIAP